MSSREALSVRQLATFYLANQQYGIDVMRVQEVTDRLSMTKIPRAPQAVQGLINLRGQIATAIGLKELFGVSSHAETVAPMTVICRVDGALLSLLVDSIGDVIEIPSSDYEPIPETIKGPVRKYLSGVYKTKTNILSVVDLDKLSAGLNQFTNLTEEN
jgi:purine-binding chemotaxis protein CheW